MKKGILALIGMILALVLILVAFFGPWYAGTEESMGVTVESSMGLTSATTKIGDMETTVQYSDLPDSDAKAVYNNTFYMTIIAIILAILAIIGMLGLSFNFGNEKTMKMIGGIFGILTFILAIVAVIYFMASLPGATPGMDSFWMEKAGPGYGWYLMLIGAIIALIGSIALFKKQAA